MAAGALSPTQAQRWTRIGALGALAMLLGYLETFVPIPIPGVKLGLANVAVLVELAAGDVAGACWVAAIKMLATGLLFGNPVTLAYSLAGTTLALVLMVPLAKLPTMRLEMVSVIGALAHEAGQLLVAQALLGTPLVWYSAPVLAVAGCVTGVLVGVVAVRVAALLEQATPPAGQVAHIAATQPSRYEDPPTRAATAAVVGFVALVALVMHTTRLSLLLGLLGGTLLACRLMGISGGTLAGALRPMVPIALITLVAQVATNQQGPALVQLAGLALTKAAVVASARMLLRLGCLCLAACLVARLVSQQDAIRLVHAALRPARAAGRATEGPELALSTALSLVPLLATRMEESRLQGSSLWSRAFWTREMPQLVEELYAAALVDAQDGPSPRTP